MQIQQTNQINKIYEDLKKDLSISSQGFEIFVEEGSKYLKINNYLKKNKTKLLISEETMKEKEANENTESLNISSYYKLNPNSPNNEKNKTNPSTAFTTYEDIWILLGVGVKENHTPDSIRTRERVLLKEFTDPELDRFSQMNFQQKRELLARKFNGKNGERIKINIKQKEILDRIDRLEKLLNKICKKLID